MQKKSIISLALIFSISVFSVIIVLVSMGTLNQDALSSNTFFGLIPVAVGVVVGLLLIVGSTCLLALKKKTDYMTFPIYGAGVLLEVLSEIAYGKYRILFIILAILTIITALAIDLKKKIGLYLLIKDFRK